MKSVFLTAKKKFLLLPIALLFFTFNGKAQSQIAKLKFEKNTIYIFNRGTKTKSGLIAEKFNSIDRFSTHVGIGFVENDQLKIYNVIDCDTSKTALVVDDLKSFICDKAYYLSVWKYQNTQQEYFKLKKICHDYTNRKVYFDFSFRLNEKDNVLYCSEFCSRVLKMINPRKFSFKPCKVRLESFYKAFLRRDELLYFPVDFFQKSKSFSKIFETNFNTEKS
ncbi:hypothetical protein EZL74_00035 [Flavobacterium silvisoli]|uniref:Permuted papain-like amidase YaeF/Yiix C92 family enzyme n=1 Tax=Flavobacterium silvisoli TaxID=2529433 RepID=A0A4Q9Z3C4_9FLAO|nr:YiiX/YebB-like N1pC/P60 family cysteine hydrolase [Flavobacterium silvisoli]TBX70924.1 hypothetical protein EZL74_00035 [Flavobacterium silvisoli]